MKMPDIIKQSFQFIPSLIQYRHEAKRLKNIDFFNYKELLKRKSVTPKFFTSVCLYGNYKAVSNKRHRKFNFLLDYLEHGVCFYDTPESTLLMGYATRPGIKNIYTYSNHRKSIIEEFLRSKGIHKHVYAIGPYILGADNFYNKEDLIKIKKQYGRILLVYPSHSIDNVLAQYDVEMLITEIEKHSSDFDSVFICLYWKDIMNEQRLKKYLNKGCTVVCNGFGSDPSFLSRQKDLLMLSDMVMTNGLGTHIGYAVCLKKPVYFFKQNKQHTDEKGSVLQGNQNVNKTENLFAEVFQHYSFDITKEQKQLVEKFWGTW